MNLQEEIQRIKEMIGLIIESSVPNENSLFDILKKNGFEKSTEDDFTSVIGGEINLNGGWLYINKDTKIYVYKDGTKPKIYFKIKDGTVKRLEAFPVDQNIINDYITNPPKPKEKTLEDFKGEIEKVSDGFSDIVKKDDGYYYGENQDKKLPNNILLTIKNTIKSRLDQIKNECDGSSLSNVEKDEINKYIEGVKSKAKSLNLVESIHINMNLQEQTNRIKQMMGLIVENDELTNRILDKISNYGIESLSKAERQYLDNKSQDVEDDEVSDIASIDSGYEFNDVVDDFEVKFIYDETEEWDDDPVEYKHTGQFFIDDEEYHATMYTDEDYNVHSFDLHDGDDYVEFDDKLEESLLAFFQEVGDKLKQSLI